MKRIRCKPNRLMLFNTASMFISLQIFWHQIIIMVTKWFPNIILRQFLWFISWRFPIEKKKANYLLLCDSWVRYSLDQFFYLDFFMVGFNHLNHLVKKKEREGKGKGSSVKEKSAFKHGVEFKDSVSIAYEYSWSFPLHNKI